MATCAAYAAQPRVNYEGKVFELKYSAKSSLASTYINEYYQLKEKYNNWTELIGVYYFPNQKSPLIYADNFRKQIVASGRPAELMENKKLNSAVLAFMTQGGKLPTKIEFNIFKCEPAPKGGTICLQYARRYFLNNVEDVEKMNKNIEENRMKWINSLVNTQIPILVEKDIDLGK